MTGIEVCRSAGTLVIAVQVPSQQTGNSKSWVRISRGIEQYEGQFIPTQTDHPNLEAASSQQSTSCGRLRAQVTGGHSPVTYEAAPKPKVTSIATSLVTNPSTSKTQKRLRIRKHLPTLHDGPIQVVTKLTEQYDGHMF